MRLDRPLLGDQLQPASIDLRLGSKATRVRASFLAGAGHTIADRLAVLGMHEIPLEPGAVLETGCVYVVPLLESLALPADAVGGGQPEELDRPARRVHARDRRRGRRVRPDAGRLSWSALCRDLPADVSRAGAHGQPAVADPLPAAATVEDDDAALRRLQQREQLVSAAAPDIADGIALSVDLSGDKDGLVGYRAKRHTGLVDVDAVGACAVADYWEPIHVRGAKRLILDPDEFYILASKEAVHVPPTHAAEMVPFNPLVGEFRVHYAGFFDPGFGHTAAGGAGSKAVLEVRSHKVPFVLEDGQIIGRLVYERLTDAPELLYGSGLGSHYQAQGLKLSKHFK